MSQGSEHTALDASIHRDPFRLGGWRQSVAVRNCITVIKKVDLPASHNLLHSAVNYNTACVN